jgi:hypothetical protein
MAAAAIAAAAVAATATRAAAATTTAAAAGETAAGVGTAISTPAAGMSRLWDDVLAVLSSAGG